ncbi:hypothetical protein RDV89_14690 [Nocardioides zeae]|uniref:CHAD domain-containing protein n=1 Tax=Nocardioides imazamoxiresistens TaxID=3231893 RepID=A0ABU3PYV3_9ACTN|nr:hypothetical protein [Nocardioides zeae]MDT9594329.1 hypothetical protein [Nocardioides zeae]
MSSSWPDRRRRGGGPSALERAQEARGLLQEQFFRVDQLQRDVGGTVASYAAMLPDRARSTGVVPGWKRLDDRAHAAVGDYLALLDQHDPVEELDPYRVHAATTAFEQGTAPLRGLADEMERFVDSYGAELGRLAEVRATVERRVAAAQAAVAAAEQAWHAMHDAGVDVPEADASLARARVAVRKLVEIADRLGPDAVEEPAGVVERLAGQARTLATEVPQRLATLATRIPSLGTRIDAVSTRAERTGEFMSGLRREFSFASWKDLADAEDELDAHVATARESLDRLRRLHADGETTAALTELTNVEDAVKAASDLVDAPRHRLERLRQVKSDPQQLFERARFALRDTRLLLRRGSPQPWGGRLDALAHELVALEGLLDAPHPDYWQLVTRMDRLHAGVDALVADFRASQRR